MGKQLQCIAWKNGENWIAAMVDHDIMQQGETLQVAMDRLKLAYAIDDQGRATGPCPVVHMFTIEATP